MIKEVKKLVSFSLGTWINFGLSFLFAPISTFLLSPSEYGKYALFILSQTLLTYLFTVGMDQVLVRFYHEKKMEPERLLINCILPIFGSFFIVSSILLLLNRELNLFITATYTSNYTLGIQLAIISLLASLNNVGTSHLRMQKAGLKFSFLQVATSLINYGVFFCYLLLVERTFQAFLIGSLVSLSVQLLIIYGRFIKIHQFVLKMRPSKQVLKQALLFGFPFVPTFLLDFLFSSSDRFFLRYFGNLEEMGIYSLALRISYAFTILQSGFHLYWVPYSMERFHRNEQDKRFYAETFSLLNFLILAVITAAVIGKPLLKGLIDEQFYPAIAFFPFLLFVPYFYTLSEVTFVGINFKSKTHFHLIINVITLAFNALFAFLLIPKWGSSGAAMTAAATYCMFFVFRSWFANKLYPLQLAWTPFATSLFCVVTFVMVDYYYIMEFWVKLVSGLGIAMVLIFLYKDYLVFFAGRFKKAPNGEG
jgi:O-antigen/teichoic acid export membrane protein